MTLPPGQRAVEGFPRFGTHFHHPPPPLPADPALEIAGAVERQFAVPVGELATLPRRELAADFHCVAGWSATGLVWEGVPFAAFYRRIVEPVLVPGTAVTHVVFQGFDRYRAIVTIEDALADEVLLAENLDGQPLDGDHGAPLRLVSPNQYGFVNVKHLCRVEVHTTEPHDRYHPSSPLAFGLRAVKPHRRARVWHEERHRYVPGPLARRLYRPLIRPFMALAARGSRRGR